MSTTRHPRPTPPANTSAARRRAPSLPKITGVRRRDDDGPTKAPETAAERLRLYLPYIAVPNFALVLGSVALVFAVVLIGGWRLAYIPAAIGETWFVLHGSPLLIDGVLLTAIPALPAVGVVALIALRVRAATAGRVSILDLSMILGLVVAIPLTLSAIALFMVNDASNVFSVGTPPVVAALAYPVLVHVIGFVLGVRRVVWRALARRAGVPEEAVDAAALAGGAFVRLLLAAGIVFLICLAFGYSRLADLLGQYPNLGPGGGFLLALLCLLYLPNAAVSTLAVLLGGGLEYAGAAVSLFSSVNVPYPPLPIFAAVPEAVPAWAPVLLVIPAGVLARYFTTRSLTYTGVAAAAVWAALLGALAGVYVAGVAGAYGVVGPNPWMLALLLMVWTAAVGFSVRAVASLRQRAKSPEA